MKEILLTVLLTVGPYGSQKLITTGEERCYEEKTKKGTEKQLSTITKHHLAEKKANIHLQEEH